jgi:hypothetical protein
MTMKQRGSVALFTTLVTCGLPAVAQAETVALQQPTATFSQTQSGAFNIGKAINGTSADSSGWGIQGSIIDQSAAFETATDIGFAGGSILTFDLDQTYSTVPGHTLGRFRLSVTTDDRSLFADGLFSGGDVTANWVVLDPSTFSALNGTTLSELGDNSLLASGTNPGTDTYTISAPTSLTGITGIRLEVLQDSSLPSNGPGRHPENGNFVLSELKISIVAVPEPSSLQLLVSAGAVWGFLTRTARARSNRPTAPKNFEHGAV